MSETDGDMIAPDVRKLEAMEESQLDDQATSLVKNQLVRQILWLRWSVSITTVIILALLFWNLEFGRQFPARTAI